MRPVLCSSITVPEGSVPDWLHLLPDGAVRTKDGRGPYRVADANALMSRSMAAGKLPLDVNHSTDLAAPKGGASPARGWIVELQQRADGIWGRVEWTAAGRRMTQDREYSGVSPVIRHSEDGTIAAILRASLTNTPNVTGLTALHSENSAEFRAMLIEKLGLDPAKITTDIIVAAATRAISRTPRAVAEILDEASPANEALTATDRHVIRAMGLDPSEYAKNLRAAKAADIVARHSTERSIGALNAADHAVIRLMGLDRDAYAKARDGRSS